MTALKLFNAQLAVDYPTYTLIISHHCQLKGIVHFEFNFLYVLAYLKGIQDVGVFFSTVSNRSCLSVL